MFDLTFLNDFQGSKLILKDEKCDSELTMNMKNVIVTISKHAHALNHLC